MCWRVYLNLLDIRPVPVLSAACAKYRPLPDAVCQQLHVLGGMTDRGLWGVYHWPSTSLSVAGRTMLGERRHVASVYRLLLLLAEQPDQLVFSVSRTGKCQNVTTFVFQAVIDILSSFWGQFASYNGRKIESFGVLYIKLESEQTIALFWLENMKMAECSNFLWILAQWIDLVVGGKKLHLSGFWIIEQ